MEYAQLLRKLRENSNADYAQFQARLVKLPSDRLLGVKIPVLRKIAKTVDVDVVLEYPDEYFEITFLKLFAISYLPYERFTAYLKYALPLIDNWSFCDSFKAKCISSNRQEFLPILEQIHTTGKEFYVRYALVVLLTEYVEQDHLPLIFSYLKKTDCTKYYVHMAAAWLTAEVLVKHFDDGVSFMKECVLDEKTHNKSIQKAIESYRLTNEQKEQIRALKIKS